MAENLHVENSNNESAIRDLEIKNRLLVDNLNAQIFRQASVYKEKTMNALHRGATSHNNLNGSHNYGQSSSPLRASSNGRNTAAGLGQNDSAFARSPLQVSRVANV